MRHITLITTGGTIDKTYDEGTGTLSNARSIVPSMLRRLRLVGTTINRIPLLSKDSLDLSDDDRHRIVETTRLLGAAPGCDGVVILHGTDTLCQTGQQLYDSIASPPIPIVLTGAMRPFEMKSSDALQNLTEAIFATGVLSPGVYAVAHGRALAFPGVYKDREARTFAKH